MKKVDWMIHNVTDKNGSNFHTHGLDKFGSLEIEINLHLRQEIGQQFCNAIAFAIKDGLVIQEGIMVEKIFNTPIFFFRTMPVHGEHEVWRAIFPDEKGMFPWDNSKSVKCQGGYREQITFDKLKVFYTEVCMGVKGTVDLDGRSLPNYEIDYIDRNTVVSKPFKYITAKGEVYYVGNLNFGIEEDYLKSIEEYFVNKPKVFCRDATAEQLSDFWQTVNK